MHELMKLLRSDSRNRLLDRFLIASIVETRGAERFRLVSENIEDLKLKSYYSMLYKSEEKHGNVFIEMALNYYPENEVMIRLEELVSEEAKICASLPHRPALH
jgi:tRNA-(ms[2]io[6]A)-hydroxylase